MSKTVPFSLRRLAMGLTAALLGGGLHFAPQSLAQVPAPFGPVPGNGPGFVQPGPGPQQPDGLEVLARGPVHEAFAATSEFPTAGPIVANRPPDPIEELPPDQRPAGENVQWIPGYWHFDDERADYVWISGFWRVPPPGRVWMPGSWRQAAGGFQYVNGFWQMPVQQSATLQYLPPPPQQLEVGPQIPAPHAASIYVPGCWVYRERYVWRPGFWIDHRPGWVWVPDHFRWTPGGYVFINGYWDYPLETRGMLFAPVIVPPAVFNAPQFVYTPQYAVSQQCMVSALFVRRGFSAYYFGDYFESRYAQAGFNPWIGGNSGFAFSVGVSSFRRPAFDPLYGYYRAAYHDNPTWGTGIHSLYAGRFRGDIPRPAPTLVQQNTVINNIANINKTVVNNTIINNNNTVINRPINSNNINNTLAMVQPISALATTNPGVQLRQVGREDRVREQQLAQQVRAVGVERRQAETRLADRQIAPRVPTDRPRQAEIAVPQQLVARAAALQAVPAAPTPARGLGGPTIAPAQPVNPVPGATPAGRPNRPDAAMPAARPARPLPGGTPAPAPAVPVNPAPARPPMPAQPGNAIAPASPAPMPTPARPAGRPAPQPAQPITPVNPAPARPAGRPAPQPAQPITPAPAAAMPAQPVPAPARPAGRPAPQPAQPITPARPARPLPGGTPAPAPAVPVTRPAPAPTPAPAAPAMPARPVGRPAPQPAQPITPAARPAPPPARPVNPAPAPAAPAMPARPAGRPAPPPARPVNPAPAPQPAPAPPQAQPPAGGGTRTPPPPSRPARPLPPKDRPPGGR